MKTLTKLKNWWLDYRKRKYIHKELTAKFNQFHSKNKNYINVLTEALLKASHVVKADVLETERIKIQHENELFYADVKKLIDKHYQKKEKELDKEKKKLLFKIREKDEKLNTLRKKVAEISII